MEINNKNNFFIFSEILFIFIFYIFILFVEPNRLFNFKLNLINEITILNKEIKDINDEIAKLKKDKDYLEQKARQFLLMKKDNERIYTLEGDI